MAVEEVSKLARKLSMYMDTFGYKVVEKADRPDKTYWGTPVEVYDLVALFFTRDGHWYLPTGDPMSEANVGSIEQWALDAYGYIQDQNNPYYYSGCGGATHLHMLVLGQDGKPMVGKGHMYWNTGLSSLPPDASFTQRNSESPHGWSNCYIEHGSGYTPPAQGVWCMCPFGLSDVIQYAGLYKSYHIATFGVWQARNPSNDNPPDNGDGTPSGSTLRQLIEAAIASQKAALSDLQAIQAMVG